MPFSHLAVELFIMCLTVMPYQSKCPVWFSPNDGFRPVKTHAHVIRVSISQIGSSTLLIIVIKVGN